VVQDTGTMAESLADLKTELDSYGKAVANQGIGTSQQTMATQSIPELLRQADEIIYDEMDDLMGHVEKDYPDLYAQFHQAKQIKGLVIGHEQNGNPPQVLAGMAQAKKQ